MHDTQKIFGYVLFERQIVKICFFALFSRASSISFSKQPSKNDTAIVHGFFFFFDKFLSFKSFPYFSIVKKTKERGCCNPVEGGYKGIFFKFYLQRNQIVCTKRITVALITILWNKNFESRKFQIFTQFICSVLITNSYLLFTDTEFFHSFFFFFLRYRKIWFGVHKIIGSNEGCSTCSRISEHEDQWGSVGGNQPVYPSSLTYHRRAHKFWDDTTVLRARSRLDY